MSIVKKINDINWSLIEKDAYYSYLRFEGVGFSKDWKDYALKNCLYEEKDFNNLSSFFYGENYVGNSTMKSYWLSEGNKDLFELWVCVKNKEVVGLITLKKTNFEIKNIDEPIKKKESAELMIPILNIGSLDIFVKKDYRGENIGSNLLNNFLKYYEDNLSIAFKKKPFLPCVVAQDRAEKLLRVNNSFLTTLFSDDVVGNDKAKIMRAVVNNYNMKSWYPGFVRKDNDVKRFKLK